MIRQALLLLAVVLPRGVKPAFYRRAFGWDVAAGVRVGLSYLDGERVTLGPGVRVGHFNVFRRLRDLRLGRGTYVANFNHAAGDRDNPRHPSELRIGDHVNLMSHHYFDVAGRVTVGDGATVGGRDSHVWSHTLAIDPDGSRHLRPTEVSVGREAYVGARCTLVGCAVPAGAFVGAGSVVTKSFPPDAQGRRLLIAGNPAIVRKTYPPVPSPTVGSDRDPQ